MNNSRILHSSFISHYSSFSTLFASEKSNFLIKNELLDGGKLLSHDLFRYIMRNIDKSMFSKFLISWLESTDLETQSVVTQFTHIEVDVFFRRFSDTQFVHSTI
jgi:hypothetical protein